MKCLDQRIVKVQVYIDMFQPYNWREEKNKKYSDGYEM